MLRILNRSCLGMWFIVLTGAESILCIDLIHCFLISKLLSGIIGSFSCTAGSWKLSGSGGGGGGGTGIKLPALFPHSLHILGFVLLPYILLHWRHTDFEFYWFIFASTLDKMRLHPLNRRIIFIAPKARNAFIYILNFGSSMSCWHRSRMHIWWDTWE